MDTVRISLNRFLLLSVICIQYDVQIVQFFSLCVLGCSIVSDSFATPWTVAYQAALYVEFSRQEYWSGLPFPPPGYLPDPGIEPASLVPSASAGGCFATLPLGKPNFQFTNGWILTSAPSMQLLLRITERSLWNPRSFPPVPLPCEHQPPAVTSVLIPFTMIPFI